MDYFPKCKEVTLRDHSAFRDSCHPRLQLAMSNLHTKFEVCVLTHYKNMKGNAMCRIWGGHWQCHHSIERLRLPIQL